MRSMCDATSLCCCIIVLVIATSDRQLILRKGFVWPCGYLCVCVGGGGGVAGTVVIRVRLMKENWVWTVRTRDGPCFRAFQAGGLI